MDKELVELLKTVTGSTETLLIWFLVLDFVKTLIGWVGAAVCMFLFGKGLRLFFQNAEL